MVDKIAELVGKNINNTPIEVIHANLRRSTPDSMFRSICPACEIGRLMVQRDQKTFELLAEDYCILCGQHYIYTDIDNFREKASPMKSEIYKEGEVIKLLDHISKEIHKAIDDNFVMEGPNELVIRLDINTLRRIE